jgi:hypothetical protein
MTTNNIVLDFNKIIAVKPSKTIKQEYNVDLKEYQRMNRTLLRVEREKFLKVLNGLVDNIRTCLSTAKNTSNLNRQIANKLYKIKHEISYSHYAINTKHRTYTMIRKDVVKIFEEFGIDKDITSRLMKHYLSLDIDEQQERNADVTSGIADRNRSQPVIRAENIENYKKIILSGLKSDHIHDIIIALCAVTGRRLSEVVQTMELDFKRFKNEQVVEFIGQRKTGDEIRKNLGYDIKLLINSDENLNDVKRAYEQLLKFRRTKVNTAGTFIADLDYIPFGNWSGSIRRRFKKHFGHMVNIVGNELKNVRAFYGCYHYEMYRKELKGKDNKRVSKNAFLSDLMGHLENDISTANSYNIFDIEL